jgi:hypothetical protein
MELYHVGRCLPLARFRFSMHLQPNRLHSKNPVAFFFLDAAYLGLVPRHLISLLVL